MSALTVERAEQLIRNLTEGLVNIKDETGEFLMTSKLGEIVRHKDAFGPTVDVSICTVPDGTVIDTKGFGGWEWSESLRQTIFAGRI